VDADPAQITVSIEDQNVRDTETGAMVHQYADTYTTKDNCMQIYTYHDLMVVSSSVQILVLPLF